MMADDDIAQSTRWYLTSLGKGVLAFAVFVVLLLLWTAYVRIAELSPLVLPTPYAVWQSLVENTLNGQLPEHSVTTLTEIVLGFLLGSVVGIALFGFSLSYDEFARTLLTAGSDNTLPLEIFGMTTNVTTPVLYALGTVTTVFSFIVIFVALTAVSVLSRRR